MRETEKTAGLCNDAEKLLGAMKRQMEELGKEAGGLTAPADLSEHLQMLDGYLKRYELLILQIRRVNVLRIEAEEAAETVMKKAGEII